MNAFFLAHSMLGGRPGGRSCSVSWSSVSSSGYGLAICAASLIMMERQLSWCVPSVMPCRQ